MIDPDDVIKGREHLSAVLCKGCHMIPSRLRISACRKCKSIVCDKCYNLADSAISDDMFDREQDCSDEE